jgi:hypothetical protein
MNWGSIPEVKLVLSVVSGVQLHNKNDGQGGSWHRSAQDKKNILERLTFENLRRDVPFGPCMLLITRILGHEQRLWDYDSIGRGSAKQLVDSLVNLGWFPDDSPRHIRGVMYDQDASNKDCGPSTKIDVYLCCEESL